MIIVHHLNNSRSQRILWLLEELNASYKIESYSRDKVTNFAPEALKKIHPLGKSPVISEDGNIIIESAAITTYIVDKYAPKGFAPNSEDSDYYDYLELMHYAEGSANTTFFCYYFIQAFLEMLLNPYMKEFFLK